ncbi:hypothetical protein ABWH97_07310 [Nitratireductor sp. ac15]
MRHEDTTVFSETGKQIYNPASISPVTFSERMKKHWESLGNCSSDRLVKQWRGMGETFSRAVLIGAGRELQGQRRDQWQVLQLPTGTGKTQGACVYASLVAKQNRSLPPGFTKTGILIVSPFIKDADQIAQSINELAECYCALARHSENPAPYSKVAEVDVLVVTHQAYVNALEDQVLQRGEDQLEHFLQWQFGRRLLTIIDESLSELVKSYSATAEDFRLVAALIDLDLIARFPRAADIALQDADTVSKMERLISGMGADELRKPAVVWTGESQDFDWHNGQEEFLRLRREMFTRRHDRDILGYGDQSVRECLRERIDDTLATMEAMRVSGGYRTYTFKKFTIHTSKLLIPKELAGPVILDATARQDPLWGFLGSQANIETEIAGVRSYRNVTLHIARAADVGKDKMSKAAVVRLSRLFENLREPLRGRRVFLCVHKALEPHALSFEHAFEKLSVDHWGNINGRNDWREFDTAILFGLPYPPDTWVFDRMLAIHSFRGDHEVSLTSTPANVRQQHLGLKDAHIITSVVQAINRVRCRKVIDQHGNCAPTDIFIVLPKGKRGDRYLARIKEEMPAINVVPWKFLLDGDAVYLSKAHYAEPVFRYMENCGPGEVDLGDLVRKLDLKKNAKKDLQSDLRNTDHPLTVKLKEIGVTYHSIIKGAKSRSFLKKVIS